MRNLLYLLIKNGGLMTLLLSQAIAFYVIVGREDSTQREIYLYNTSKWANYVNAWRKKFQDYNGLIEKNKRLQAEIAQLRGENENMRLFSLISRDTINIILPDSALRSDSLRRLRIRPSYEVIPAQVVDNSVHYDNNWILLNRGSADGIVPHCGVIASDGIVGVLRHVDKHFSVAMSVLHRQTRVSAMLKKHGAYGSLVWEGKSPRNMTLKYIPKHIEVSIGDTVATSGLSAMFPKNHLIGIVDAKPSIDPDNTYFMNIPVRLTHDLSRTDAVYIVRNIFGEEMQRLMEKTKYE
ncbi:MAG: rod shape-determining protein MreC [Saprospiraceae bacterium]